jgi:hypothetical protein
LITELRELLPVVASINGNWTATKIFDGTSGSAGTFSAGQVLSGGAPGPYRETTLGTSGAGVIVVAQEMSGAVYNPAVSGAISQSPSNSGPVKRLAVKEAQRRVTSGEGSMSPADAGRFHLAKLGLIFLEGGNGLGNRRACPKNLSLRRFRFSWRFPSSRLSA